MGSDDQDRDLVPTAPPSLPAEPASSRIRQALSDRLTLSEALDVVERILRGYPRDFPDTYVGALADVLIKYPRTVAVRAVEIARQCLEFPPSAGKLIQWLELHTAPLHDSYDREVAIERQLEERKAYEARLKKPRPTLAQLKAQYGENWGIEQDKVDPAVKERVNAALDNANKRLLDREREAAGMPQAQDGAIMVSPALVKLLKEKEKRRQERAAEQPNDPASGAGR